MATIFETETCTRCGGSGRYSFNTFDRDTCLGCNRSGTTLSKRGKAAKAYFISLLKKPASSIKAGDQIFEQGQWRTVQSVGPSGSYQLVNGSKVALIDVRTKKISISFVPGATLTAVTSNEELEQAKQKALEYQATLTKTGRAK